MDGKTRGVLVLFIFFMAIAVGTAVVGFVDLGNSFDAARLLASEVFPMGDEEQTPSYTASESSIGAAEFLTEAAMQALKDGKAKPGDILELGQLYMKAQSDGHVDEEETEAIFRVADRAGIVDAVIDKALEPASPPSKSSSGQVSIPQSTGQRDSGLGQELRALISEVESARKDGSLNPGELVNLLEKAKNARLQERIQAMIPPGYDDSRARTIARDLAKAMITGRASIQDARAIADLFIQAQADGRIDHAEIDHIATTAERLAL